MILSIIILVAVIGFDQLSKWLIFGTPSRSIIGDLLWFQTEKNTGAAFSMLSGNNLLFVIITSVACILLCYVLFSKKLFTKKLEKISLALILAGAISNLVDRIIFAYVRDFIYLKFINFAVFNVADMAISIGAVLLVIAILFVKEKDTEDDRT